MKKIKKRRELPPEEEVRFLKLGLYMLYLYEKESKKEGFSIWRKSTSSM
jgi:hypothetical protein